MKLQHFRKLWIWTFDWLVHQINSLYEALKLKQNFRKNKVVTGKIPFFVIGPFCTPHSVCLNLATDREVLFGNVLFSFLVLSTKKRYSSFLERICVFEKIYFKVNVSKMFKISSDCNIKNMPISQTERYFKNP